MSGKTNPKKFLKIAVLLVGMGLIVNTNVCKSFDVFTVLDDMEDYNDHVEIRRVWRDGYANVRWGGIYPDIYLVRGGSSGSNLNVSTAVGSPFNGGTGPTLNDEAMVLRYDNDGFTYTGHPGEEMWIYDAPYYSEIEANTVGNNSLNVGQNWAATGYQRISLSFQGHPVSDGDYDANGLPVYTINGRGRDIFGRHDEFFFYSQYPFVGHGSIQVQVLSMDNTDPWAKAGVMIRDKRTPYSKFVAVFVTPGNGVTFQYRDVEDGPVTEITKPGISAPQYIKLIRNLDDSFEAKHSDDGLVWEDVNAPGNPPVLPQIFLGTIVDPNIYIGSAVSSHDANEICSADFTLLVVSPVSPVTWNFDNIGTNDPEQLYLALEDTVGNVSVVEHPDANAATLTSWQEWNIPLTAFTGVDFNSIKKVYIGLGDRDAPVQGGSGTVYIDDIRLYKRGSPLFVDGGAPAGGDGSSWANAYNYLQDALDATQSDDAIWVAQGTYNPDQGAGHTPGDRRATFQLINSVSIYGGYAGLGEPDPNARDINMYKTILSGDLNGDDGPNFANNGENSYHVVTGSSTDATAILEGFTITGGNANGSSPHYDGGGMYNDSSSPTVNNCTFSGNSAWRGGGGMYNDGSSPTMANCTFVGNIADKGGALCNISYSSPTLVNCIVYDNSATTFAGGGIYNVLYSSPLLTNCTFYNNTAVSFGGGICNEAYSSPTITNCILRQDTAGIADKEIHDGANSSSVVTYSDVQGGWPDAGNTNIDADPLFADPNNPDPNLRSLRLKWASPCIDAGDSSVLLAIPVAYDLDGKDRYVDIDTIDDTGFGLFKFLDMGAYEFDCIGIAGDINCDGVVDFKDVAILCGNWLAGIEP